MGIVVEIVENWGSWSHKAGGLTVGAVGERGSWSTESMAVMVGAVGNGDASSTGASSFLPLHYLTSCHVKRPSLQQNVVLSCDNDLTLHVRPFGIPCSMELHIGTSCGHEYYTAGNEEVVQPHL